MKEEAKPEAALPIPAVNENKSTEEQIAQRAYKLWQQRGGQHGNDLADWLQAERQIVEQRVTGIPPSR